MYTKLSTSTPLIKAMAAICGLLTVLCYWTRFSLNPPVLWNDDLWIAVLLKYSSLGSIWEIAPPTSFGFAVTQKAALSLISDPTAAALTLPFISGLLGIFVFAWGAQRHSKSWTWPVAAFLLLSTNHHLVEFFTRGKHYGLDLLASAAIVVLAVAAFTSPSTLRRMAVYGAALMGLFFSSASVFVSVPIVAVLLVHPGLKKEPREWVLLAGCAVSAPLYYGFYLCFQARPGMTSYWKEYLHPTAYLFPFFNKSLPPYLRDLTFLIPIGLLWSAKTRAWRPFAACYAGSVLMIAIFAAAGKYPLGGGRMDIWSYPLHVAMFCIGLWRISTLHKVLRWFPHLIAVLCLGKGLWLAYAEPVSYVDDHLALRGKMMAQAGEPPPAGGAQPESAQQTLWAWCYYTDASRNSCLIVPDPDSTNGFRIESAGPVK